MTNVSRGWRPAPICWVLARQNARHAEESHLQSALRPDMTGPKGPKMASFGDHCAVIKRGARKSPNYIYKWMVLMGKPPVNEGFDGICKCGMFHPPNRGDLKLERWGFSADGRARHSIMGQWVNKGIHDDPRKFFEYFSNVDAPPCFLNMVGT